MSGLLSRRFVLKAGTLVPVAASAPRPLKAAEASDVIVIGTGLAGLHATWMLEEQGVKVTVLEGRNRPGGRVFTLDDVPGKPEAGGNGIGGSYARVLDHISRLSLDMQPMRVRTDPGMRETILNYRGQMIHEDDWASSNLNPFPEARRDQKPWEFQWAYYFANNPLTDIEDWYDPKFAAHDIPLYDFAKAQGLDDESIFVAFDRSALYGTSPHDVSALAMYQVLTLANYVRSNFEGGSMAVVGGNQRLPDAILNNLKSDVHFGKSVVGLKSESEAAEVHCIDGTRYRAKRVIVTAPFPALRNMIFDPILTGKQAEAVAHLGYSVAYQVHFLPKSKFWEADGLPLTMWTDGPVGRVAGLFYGDSETDPTSIVTFVNGRRALALDRMTHEEATAYILALLAEMRPSTKGQLEPIKVQSWQQDPFAGGVYSSWGPGQITNFVHEMAKPRGRIHFAGEHTARLNRGMEGAMESGERAVLEVLNAI